MAGFAWDKRTPDQLKAEGYEPVGQPLVEQGTKTKFQSGARSDVAYWNNQVRKANPEGLMYEGICVTKRPVPGNPQSEYTWQPYAKKAGH